MLLTIKQPDYLYIKDPVNNSSTFGGNQAWYPSSWARQAGCGATSAANVTAYLSQTREEYKNLYSQATMNKADFTKHMKLMFEYITPGLMGVNHVDKFTSGLAIYAEDKNISLKMDVIYADTNKKGNRKREDLEAFVTTAIKSDSPIAFLSLNRGAEYRLQNWHWITLISINPEEDRIMAIASDEGRQREFDLLLWYMTTGMHGGLIRFS